MEYRIIKTNRRYSYHNRYAYILEFCSHKQKELYWFQGLEWCTRTWGWAGPVVETVRLIMEGEPKLNTTWSYWVPDGVRSIPRIYLKSGEELAWFKLAHPVDQKP